MTVRRRFPERPPLDHWEARVDLAAAFRWTARLDMHEAVANHFSLGVDEKETRFLINPNQMHFSRIRASDPLEPRRRTTRTRRAGPERPMQRPGGCTHRSIAAAPHARCVMHLHSPFATVLASLEDSVLPPIDLNTATFFNRMNVDEALGGLAFEAEGERCAAMLTDPGIRIMVMGNHGVLAIGDTGADTFNRLYHFERATQTCVRALQCGKPLRLMSAATADRVARELDRYPGQAERHFAEIKALLDEEGSSYAS